MDVEAGFALSIAYAVLVLLFLGLIAINAALLRSAVQKVLFPGGVPAVLRACPHCQRQMPARATVCSFCRRESEAWVLHEGRWWTTRSDGTRVYLEPTTGAWIAPEEEPAG